jgi:4-diphosphocytidyl-2-C-methyl-D-erythritol kinase
VSASPLPLRALAPAKINLGLFLGQRRAPGGRHELVSVMQSISLTDELTLEFSAESAASLAGSGAPGERASGDEVICPGVPGPSSANLAAEALRMFRDAAGWDAAPLRLTIDKRVPVTAGLGGGSGDAAAALRLAASASGRGHEARQQLLELAAALGSDVPAQLEPGRWLVSGAGERLQPLRAPQPPFGVLLLSIAAPLASADVYAEADRLGLARRPRELVECRRAFQEALAEGASLPPAALLVNDLETAARSLCPAIDGSLRRIRASGADLAFVSGSGPTAVGLFVGSDGPAQAQRAARSLGEGPPARDRAGAFAAVPVAAEFAAPLPTRQQARDLACESADRRVARGITMCDT